MNEFDLKHVFEAFGVGERGHGSWALVAAHAGSQRVPETGAAWRRMLARRTAQTGTEGTVTKGAVNFA